MYAFINNMQLNCKNKNTANIKMTTTITGVKNFALFSRPYLDTYNKCYKNIIVVNLMPCGPLAKITKRVTFTQLSQFKSSSPCEQIDKCGLALTSLNSICGKCGDLMITDEVPQLFSYLLSNGYTIDTSITKMINDSELAFNTYNKDTLICFVTYNN